MPSRSVRMVRACAVLLCAAVCAGQARVDTRRSADRPSAAHPIISEVLYAVPTDGGDASLDGERSATGDEFIELFNPHGTSINLAGYTLTDGLDDSRRQIVFTFPAAELKPGQCAVVFNGYKTRVKGSVGDEKAAAGSNGDFGGALVFTMNADSNFKALGNRGDRVLLTDPSGRPVAAVYWGRIEQKKDADAPAAYMGDEAPMTTAGSVQRAGARGEFKEHGAVWGVAYSPGVFDAEAPSEPVRGTEKNQEQRVSQPRRGR